MRNGVKRRLRDGETIIAAWLETGSPEVAEILVRTGWSVLVIDCEHGAAGLEEGLGLIRAVEASGGDAMVRVPDPSEATLKRALDRGARSLIVPMVNSVAQARDIASFVRYPPMGRRGYAASIVRASGYGAWPLYGAEANEEVFLAVQIEHRDAVEAAEEIMAVEGIDMVFIGPNDLAGSMGHFEQLDAPDVVAAMSRVEEAASQADMLVGGIEGARDCGALGRDGYRLIVCSNDVSLLAAASRDAVARCKAALDREKAAS
ncbi:4-hydroxy-2-oxoheptanedioate aldolase [Palleronia aestuarii]|uniref:4-hydroxy-2-oxoheptanedioate aldolase n=1 Tax=Palleronia aestuarii TaxID=568105 RepID=A0A2W7Q3U4_9RHOB|nr:aldolase/citrate lyase family protein [Palleronia aestuarii]PZX16319.1 4-hydroxy-2-oxoheptanedioate aldolase [Palleronia aestuarii]